MITDLIDFLVDTSNTFGSLVNCLMCRCKDYRRVVQGAVNGTGQEFDDLCCTLPQLPAELAQCPVKHPVVLVDSVRGKGARFTVMVVLLDRNLHYLHAFSSLVVSWAVRLPGVPCYWNL